LGSVGREIITFHNSSESSGTTVEGFVMKLEEQPQVKFIL